MMWQQCAVHSRYCTKTLQTLFTPNALRHFTSASTEHGSRHCSLGARNGGGFAHNFGAFARPAVATALPTNGKATPVNPLTPTDPYSGRTAPLTSKHCILYIYSTNTCTEYFKHGIYSPFFSLQNVVCFIILTYLVPVLFIFYIQGVLKLKKNNSGTKRLRLPSPSLLTLANAGKCNNTCILNHTSRQLTLICQLSRDHVPCYSACATNRIRSCIPV